MHRLGASGVLHILDEILFIAESEEKCQADLNSFLNLCEYLGVPITEEKTVGPHTVLQFAGITLDTVKQVARLPDEKFSKKLQVITWFL